MINGSPQIVGFAGDLHENLVEMPTPLLDLAHGMGAAFVDHPDEECTEAIDPCSNAFITDIDTPFVQQVFDIPKGKWVSDVHHHRNLDHLGRCFEILERRFDHEKAVGQGICMRKTGSPNNNPEGKHLVYTKPRFQRMAVLAICRYAVSDA